jgi:RimJ/RimL family protein N-acetyltransferase
MRALQVNLKQEVTCNDALTIMGWMENHEITKYLNEVSNIAAEIRNTISRVNMTIMTHLFNRDGSFFLICTEENNPVGFLKLVRLYNEAEMVIVIGETDRWGCGLGTESINQGLNQAFFQWRIPRVIAKIDPNNIRSIKAFEKCGFVFERDLTNSKQYSLSMDDYIKRIL